MKIFNFECKPCGINEERFVRENNPVHCKKCEGEMRRLVSAPGMVKTNFANKTGFKTRS